MAILEVFGGELEKLQFQKLLMLFTTYQQNKSYHFVPYKFGCFSFQANADLGYINLNQLIEDSKAPKNTSLATGVNLTNLKEIKVPVLPLPEQRAIVSRIEELFSELDHSITNLKSAQAKLEIYRQAVLKKAFEGGFTEEWRGKQSNLYSSDDLDDLITKGQQDYFVKQIEDWEIALKHWEKSGKSENRPKKPRPLTIPDPPNNEHNERKWNLPENWIWTQLGVLCFVTKLAGFEYTDYVKYDADGDLPVLKAENAGLYGFKKTDYSKVKSESVKELNNLSSN